MEFTRYLLEWLSRWLPERCILCDGPAGDLPLCSGCRDDLPRLRHACPRCAEPMPMAGESLCGRCQQAPPAFDTVYSPFLYAEPVNSLIRKLKYDRQLHLARLLGTLLGQYLEHALHDRPDLVVPMPMHRRRLGQRGFNQALELARFVGRQLDLPVAPLLASRSRATLPQAGLKPRERRKNVRGTFAISAELPRGSTILLIDDIMTTGASADALARSLRKAGAASITVATVARAARLP